MKLIFLLSIFHFNFAYAEKARPLSVHLEAGMDLGTLVSGDGSRKIEAGNSPSSRGARFRIEGEPFSTFSFVLPDQVRLTHVQHSSNQIILTNFTSNPSSRNGALDSNGKQIIYVGATITVGSQVYPGEYKGAIPIEVLSD